MFCPLEYREGMIIFRGLFFLLVMILLGVGAAQQQINSLTQWQENLWAFSLTHNPRGFYTLNIDGSVYELSALYPVGEIINNEGNVTVKIMKYRIEIPKYIELNCKEELALLELYIKTAKENLNVYDKAFR